MPTAVEIHRQATERALRAARLRRRGLTFREIGRQMGDGVTVETARQAVLKGERILKRRGMTIETGWMVEQRTRAAIPHLWLSHVDPMSWSSDPNAGIRFCRRQDAAGVMEDMRKYVDKRNELLVTDHEWSDMVYLPEQPLNPTRDIP